MQRGPAPRESASPLAATAHIPVLDGVRGLAILLVIACHTSIFGGPYPVRALDALWQRAAAAGWTGVNLFFVLSGFLITGILYDAKGANAYFRTFYARRVLRIVPIYYLFLAFWFFLRPQLGTIIADQATTPHQQLWFWTYLTNVPIAFHGWPAFPKVIDHFWSLAVEEQFYLVWPLIVFALNRRGIIIACLIAIAIAVDARYEMLMLSHWEGARVFTLCCLDDLAVGGLLAMLARSPAANGLRPWKHYAMPLALASALALLLLPRWQAVTPLGLANYALQPLARSVLFGTLLLAALTFPTHHWLARWLSTRPMRTMGKYSYAIYIIHQPIIFTLMLLGWKPWRVPTIFGSTLDQELSYFLFIVLASLGVAMLTWRFIEKPCLDLKRYFPYRWPHAVPRRASRAIAIADVRASGI